MDEIKCCIAKDLLPLYIDDVLSQDSASELRRHLQTCEGCSREYQALTQTVILPSAPEVQKENTWMLKKFKRDWKLKKILIAAISSILTLVLAIFFFFAVREYIGEDSELFQPKTKAYAGQVGQMHLGNVNGLKEWSRLTFVKQDLFSNAEYWNEPYLEFDNPFYDKNVINSGNSSSAVQMRILDTEGNVVVEPFVVRAGKSISLEQLESNTPYIVEIRAEGDFYEFTFD